MQLKSIKIDNFKRLAELPISLTKINVVVGGNNAGKSSLLQGIHFSVATATAAREQSETTFATDLVTYIPAGDFAELRHGQPYRNGAGQADSKVEFVASEGDNELTHSITIRRGRNYGNISCDRKGDTALGLRIANSVDLFSIYVPGLAGIPQREEYRPERAVIRGVASGDANLYLRNVLWLLKCKNALGPLKNWMQRLFDGFDIDVTFDGRKQTTIDSKARINGRWVPLELGGTGVQQALQIFSYVCLFKPSLLLLDEPDSHLHPDNQYALAEALQLVASESETCVLACTHSKHLVDALYGDANFIWLKAGKLEQIGPDIPRLSLLMDIGALDNFDKIWEGVIDYVILSEDQSFKPLGKLLAAVPLVPGRFLIYSYKTSSALQSAFLLVNFIKEIAPNTKVIIHRDRDFMTDAEAERVRQQITAQGATPMITRGSDVESYFCAPAHVAALLGRDVPEIETWIAEITQANQVEIQHSFTRKRDELKPLLYRSGQGEPPDTLQLLGPAPFPSDKLVGKFLLKKMRGGMHARFGMDVELVAQSEHLDVNDVRAALGNQLIAQAAA